MPHCSPRTLSAVYVTLRTAWWVSYGQKWKTGTGFKDTFYGLSNLQPLHNSTQLDVKWS